MWTFWWLQRGKSLPKETPKSLQALYNSDRGCQFGSECAYNHTDSIKSKGPTNELQKKVEVLETIVIEMAKEVIKLEAELKDIKSVQSQS